jgi:hypothetical protein
MARDLERLIQKKDNALRHDLHHGDRSARDDRLGVTSHHLRQRGRRPMTQALQSLMAPVSLDEPALVQG